MFSLIAGKHRHEALSLAEHEAKLLEEVRFHKTFRREVRQDMQRILDRLQSQLDQVEIGLSIVANDDVAQYGDVAMRAVKALSRTIPHYPDWMEREQEDPLPYVQPVCLEKQFASASDSNSED